MKQEEIYVNNLKFQLFLLSSFDDDNTFKALGIMDKRKLLFTYRGLFDKSLISKETLIEALKNVDDKDVAILYKLYNIGTLSFDVLLDSLDKIEELKNTSEYDEHCCKVPYIGGDELKDFSIGCNSITVDENIESTPKLKVKKLSPDAVLPVRANESDAGYDVVAIDEGVWSDDRTYIEYKTGIAIELPLGFHVELFPRSSISKTDLVLANGVGLVDNGYRNELKFRFKYIPRSTANSSELQPILYKKGDRIGQIVLRSTIEMEIKEVDELSSTDRGLKGFGSSGR